MFCQEVRNLAKTYYVANLTITFLFRIGFGVHLKKFRVENEEKKKKKLPANASTNIYIFLIASGNESKVIFSVTFFVELVVQKKKIGIKMLNCLSGGMEYGKGTFAFIFILFVRIKQGISASSIRTAFNQRTKVIQHRILVIYRASYISNYPYSMYQLVDVFV